MARTYSKSNRSLTELQNLLTVKDLKKSYLFGLDTITDANGNSLSDDTLQGFIDAARSFLETDLDLALVPRQENEERDFISNSYTDWGYINLYHNPVISIQRVFISFIRESDGSYDPNNEIDFPASWWRLTPHSGVLRMIPNAKFPARLAIDQNGNFFPEVFKTQGIVPNMFVIQYTHGLKEGQVPPLVNHAIGMLAAIFALTPLGNLVLGAGISGSSLGLDGLSQSITTTNSSQGGSFSGQISDYKAQLFGSRPDDHSAIITILRRSLKGQNINFL